MGIVAVLETGRDIFAFFKGVSSLDEPEKPVETIQLPEHELLKILNDGRGTTLLYNQKHAAPLVGQRADGKDYGRS